MPPIPSPFRVFPLESNRYDSETSMDNSGFDQSNFRERISVAQLGRPVNPFLREVIEDLKKVEEYVTFGFPPPKAIVPLERKSNNKELHALLNYILSRLDNPKLADKFADFVAGALESIANKIEGKSWLRQT
ncbi:MAG: hypothetical protein QW175_07020 [Candidatus Bathyarchaeia archaeon]